MNAEPRRNSEDGRASRFPDYGEYTTGEPCSPSHSVSPPYRPLAISGAGFLLVAFTGIGISMKQWPTALGIAACR